MRPQIELQLKLKFLIILGTSLIGKHALCNVIPLTPNILYEHHFDSVGAVVLSPNGKYLVITPGNGNQNPTLRDLSTGKEHELRSYFARVDSVYFSDNSKLLTYSRGNLIYRTADGTLVSDEKDKNDNEDPKTPLRAYPPSNGLKTKMQPLSSPPELDTYYRFSNSGDYALIFYSGPASSVVQIKDKGESETVYRLENTVDELWGEITWPAFIGDRRIGYFAYNENNETVFRIADLKTDRVWVIDPKFSRMESNHRFSVSRDGSLLAVAWAQSDESGNESGHQVYVYDLRSLDEGLGKFCTSRIHYLLKSFSI